MNRRQLLAQAAAASAAGLFGTGQAYAQLLPKTSRIVVGFPAGGTTDVLARLLADSVAAGVIPRSDAEKLVIVCGVFIHWLASDNKKIYDYNYQATMQAIANAMQGRPTVDEMIARKDTAAHPFVNG